MSKRLLAVCLVLVVLTFIAAAAMLNVPGVVVSILAGALTGLGETLLMYPLENIKTQQQLSSASMFETASRTISNDGWSGLYRGIAPILIGAIPTQALRWGSIEMFCASVGGGDCGTVWDKVIAGMVSGVIVAIIVGVPIETMKTEMIHQQFFIMMSPTETPVAARSTEPFDSHGSSLCKCKGWLPTVLKKVMNQSIRFPAHSIALDSLCYIFIARETCVAREHPVLTFVAGAFAGVSSIAVTQPIDVVKTRMQGFNSHRYSGVLDCMRAVTREEGWRVLLEGMWARVLRSSLGAGLTFTLFPVAQGFVRHLLNSDDA